MIKPFLVITEVHQAITYLRLPRYQKGNQNKGNNKITELRTIL
jgi:hypothetical protein